MPSSLRGGAVMRKVLLGTAALIALVAPAISGDMRAPLYKARKGNPGSHGQPRLHMICVDGGSGLLAALPSVLHGIPVQRCWAHKFRNVLDKVRKADQPKVKRALHKIMNAAIRRKRPTAAMPCLPRDRKEIWTDLRWAVAGVSVGPEQSPGVSIPAEPGALVLEPLGAACPCPFSSTVLPR
jgi:Transposase, Mutator family